ncbi:MAG: RloB domain-containing protein [Methylococcales bacterium]|nr:RloB domain-containing protein [Methylococcales bacterium]
MARRFPKPSGIKRWQATKSAKKKIIIICEGRKTEPEYIKEFVIDKKHPLVECKTINGVGVPKSIVDRAITEKKKLLKQAKKSGDSFEMIYEIWCVSDRDEHPRVREEIQRANDNGLMYVLSNPCIELWGYLHYFQNDAPTHRHDMQRMLSGVMSSYNHAQGAVFNYADMRESYSNAVDRAKKLKKRRNEEGSNPYANPSTNMYELMEAIEEN